MNVYEVEMKPVDELPTAPSPQSRSNGSFRYYRQPNPNHTLPYLLFLNHGS